MKQNIICIAGAHRSGTSMLTRLLHGVGLALGAEADLMPAAADNPDGFWENLRFVRLNDEILNALGAAWDLPPPEDQSFANERFSAARAKAKVLITSLNAESAWGWKDPRNCLTLSFWQAMISGLKTVVIVRNPLEAAYSMHRRNGTSYALGLRLWEIYNRRLLSQTPPDHRIVTNYETFFERPEAELERIISFAGLSSIDTAGVAAIVTKERRHTTFTKEQLIDAGVSEELLSLYDSLTTEAAEFQEATESEQEIKSDATPRNDCLAGAANLLNIDIPESETTRRELAQRRGDEIEYQDKIGQLKARIESLTQELSDQNTHAALEIGRRDGRITELQSAYTHLDKLLLREHEGRDKLLTELERLRRELADQSARAAAELEGLRQELADQSARAAAELTTLRQELPQALKQLDQLRDRLRKTNRLLHTYSIQLSERETECASLTSRVRKQLGDTKRLVRMLSDTERAADQLRESRRWILVNPFAWLASCFSKQELRGFGHLDKIVEKFRAWRSAHPEIEELESSIAALRSKSAYVSTLLGATEVEPLEQRVEFKPLPPKKPIEFRTQSDVEVSVIIPAFNQLEFTRACLASLQEHSGDTHFEVIVVDDCSSDRTEEVMKEIPGLVYLRNETNSGFIFSCNRGAKRARGRYLLFLNNDTVVTPGWMTLLRDTFDLEPKAGLVGSKLVYPDGRLQEAGGIIWRDASGWNRGKSQDPEKPEYSFLREVDYCSAASVMIPKILFQSLGGFESKYAPGYYEDVDLAFKVRRHGYKVLYQPMSKVIHYEGATGGTDLTTGAKKHQVINRATFAGAWGDELARRPVNGDTESFEKLSLEQKHVLVIDHHLPMIDRDAGSVRMFHILCILQNLGHRVTFIPDNLADIPPYGDHLRKRGIEVLHHPYCKSVREYLEKNGPRCDVVILSRCDFARKYISDVRRWAPQSRIIFDTVDLHHLRLSREAELTQDAAIKASAEEKKQQEFDLIDEADETWVVSQYEQDLLKEKRPQKSIQVVPTIVEVPGSNTPFGLRHDFLFIGSFQHSPNADAVLFFAREVFPMVLACIPGVKFYVIGDKAPPSVVALASENIVITGLQPDVGSYFESVRLSVAPLRFGAGVKGKINQSMAYGVPVVATSLAVEGMPFTDGEDISLADSAVDFGRAVVALYQDQILWEKLSQNGLSKTLAAYSPAAVRKHLARLFGEQHTAEYRAAKSWSAVAYRSGLHRNVAL